MEFETMKDRNRIISYDYLTVKDLRKMLANIPDETYIAKCNDDRHGSRYITLVEIHETFVWDKPAIIIKINGRYI